MNTRIQPNIKLLTRWNRQLDFCTTKSITRTLLIIASIGIPFQVSIAQDNDDEASDKVNHMHPLMTSGESTISGWLTMIAQGTNGSKDASTNKDADKSEGSLSADIFFDTKLDGGKFFLHLDIQQGMGLVNIPPLLVAPNGNATGPNNDIESFNSDQVHVDEAWYETTFGNEKWVLTLGQLDPTAYFDTNNYANNERFQFIANQFGNNPTLEFGGTGNFYGPGVRLAYTPTDNWVFSFSSIDSDGDYSSMFTRPFIIGEVDYAREDGTGNYRFYAWQNPQPHYLNSGGAYLFATAVGDPSVDKTDLLGDENRGFGISIDQELTKDLGVWMRFGEQDETVAQFYRHISTGLQLTGDFIGRSEDVAGIGIGITQLSDDYKATNPDLENQEQFFEAYYNFALTNALQLTPDIQFYNKPVGDGTKNSLTVYGVRAGVLF
jgi:hypothetical protein